VPIIHLLDKVHFLFFHKELSPLSRNARLLMEKPVEGPDSSLESAENSKKTVDVRRKKRVSKKRNTRKASSLKETRKRVSRSFPASSFEETLEFAKAILRVGSGNPVRRLTLFNELEKSPESGPSRQLITNASRYELIRGSYKSEQLELTPDGLRAIDEESPSRERAKARIKLAIEDIEIFKSLYERFVGNKLPARAVLIDAAKELDIDSDAAEEAVDTFVVNLKFVGLLQTLSGADRIVTVDHFLDTIPAISSFRPKIGSFVF
jgi:hypothetical protein